MAPDTGRFMVQCQVRQAAQEGLEVINKWQDDAGYRRHGRIDIDREGSAGDRSRGGASTQGRVCPLECGCARVTWCPALRGFNVESRFLLCSQQPEPIPPGWSLRNLYPANGVCRPLMGQFLRAHTGACVHWTARQRWLKHRLLGSPEPLSRNGWA